MNQRGFIHLLPLILVLVLIGAVVFAFYKGIIKIPFSLPFQKQLTKVELKTEYKNPFDKKTQFVNPFDDYKNPFVVNK